MRRRCATPVPRAADRDEWNTLLRARCEAERSRIVPSLFGPFPIGARFAEEQAAAAPRPRHRFDPCVIHPAVVVDQDQTVAFDTNRHRVPRPFAFPMVTVKGYVEKVVIVAGGQPIATPARSRERHTAVLDPLPYLAALGRKPGALDHAPVCRDWELPACFADFRAALEQQHAAAAGARRFARVLQLLGEHPRRRVRDAVASRRDAQLSSAEAVIRRTRVLAAIAATRSPAAPLDAAAAPPIHGPRPDLSRFDRLLGHPAHPETSRDDTGGIDGDDTATGPHVRVFCA